MKNSAFTCFGAFLLLSVLSPAQTAPASTTSSGTVLGLIEGTIAVCSRVNPGSAGTYEALDLFFTNNQSPAAINQVRHSSTYEQSYLAISKTLEALSTSQIKAACSAH